MFVVLNISRHSKDSVQAQVRAENCVLNNVPLDQIAVKHLRNSQTIFILFLDCSGLLTITWPGFMTS